MKKVMQKFILCLMLVFGTMVLVGTDAKAELKTGKCGDKVTYTFDSGTGVLTISGEGPMKDYVAADVLNPSTKASPFSSTVSPADMITSVVIENGVTSIGNYAFHAGYLKSVTIPDSVTSIGTGAFQDCFLLESVTIPNSVTKIGASAFNGDDKLESVTMSDNVTSVGEDVFKRTGYYNNTANWENGILYSGNVLLATTIEIPSGGFTIKEGTRIIADKAFYTKRLDYGTEMVIPDSVIYIGNYAFQMCYGMQKVTLGKGVTSIGKGAFTGCMDLNRITIDRNVTSIGEDAFKNCASNFIYKTIEISGYKGTTAESYATANKHRFVALDAPQATQKPTATQKPAATKKPVATKKPSARKKEVIKGKAPKFTAKFYQKAKSGYFNRIRVKVKLPKNAAGYQVRYQNANGKTWYGLTKAKSKDNTAEFSAYVDGICKVKVRYYTKNKASYSKWSKVKKIKVKRRKIKSSYTSETANDVG